MFLYKQYLCGSIVSFGNGHVKGSIVLSSFNEDVKKKKEVIVLWWCAYERKLLDRVRLKLSVPFQSRTVGPVIMS